MAYGSVLGRNTKPQFVPTFAISGPLPGDTVTVSYGGTTVEAVEDNGVWYAKAWAYGSYTISVGSKSTTVNVDEVKLYEVTLITVDTTLNNNSWDIIRKVADMGQASNYWKVGDRKAVVLNGTVGILELSNYTTYCFILGFNHNAELEGNNTIHFQFGKTALSGGKDICLCDERYNNTGGGFRMNSSRTNVGGWADSEMRSNNCGGFRRYVIPELLRSNIKSINKYTDNTGDGSSHAWTANDVTATEDYFFLLSRFEVFGDSHNTSPYENDKQKQYSYYSAGNSKQKYRHDNISNAARWWLRSPVNNSIGFAAVSTSGGTSDNLESILSYGFASAFCV